MLIVIANGTTLAIHSKCTRRTEEDIAKKIYMSKSMNTADIYSPESADSYFEKNSLPHPH